MKLYKDNNGLWVVGGKIVPQGKSLLEVGDAITISIINSNSILFRGQIKELQKENGDSYADLDELLLECKDFFSNPLNPLKEDVEGLQEDVTALQEGKADLVEGKVPDEQLPETTFPTIAVENIERTTAEALLILQARIQALEGLLAAGVYSSVQSETVSAVTSLKYKGAELILLSTGAPSVAPDFIGQFYIDTTAGVTYQAKGITNAADWKATSNS